MKKVIVFSHFLMISYFLMIIMIFFKKEWYIIKKGQFLTFMSDSIAIILARKVTFSMSINSSR